MKHIFLRIRPTIIIIILLSLWEKRKKKIVCVSYCLKSEYYIYTINNSKFTNAHKKKKTYNGSHDSGFPVWGLFFIPRQKVMKMIFFFFLDPFFFNPQLNDIKKKNPTRNQTFFSQERKGDENSDSEPMRFLNN